MSTFCDWFDTHVLNEVAIEGEVVMVAVVGVAGALVGLIVFVVNDGRIVDDKSSTVLSRNGRC